MNKVIFTAKNARYMVQHRYLDYSWNNEKSFHALQDAQKYASKEKLDNPDYEYQVVDTQAKEN